MKPRILVLTSTFPHTSNSGEPRFVADLCKQIASKFTVTVLTQHRPGSAIHEKNNQYEIFRFRYAPKALELLSEEGGITSTLKNNKLLWLLIPLFFLFQVLSIRKHLKSDKYCAIHAHWVIPQGLAATIANSTLRNPVPVFCTGHGGDIFGLQGKVLSRIKKWVIDHCAAVTVVSRSMKNYLEADLKVRPDKIHVIPMGTNLSEIFTPREVKRTPGQIIFVGRLVEKKGLRYLLEAVPPLLIEIKDLKLIIVGAGPEKGSLSEMTANLGIKHHVEFVGPKGHEAIPELYSSSEVCVLPFVQAKDGDMEGFGLVTVEAMGCKCPVVVGEVPAIKDIVLHSQTGIICNPKDRDQLVDSILSLMKNSAFRDELAENAYRHVNENFSWEKIGKRYIELFELTTKPVCN